MGAVLLIAEKVRKFWNGWEIRGLVLLSLLLQIFLIIFGSRRKSTPSIWIRFPVWLAYLCADWVATFSLGSLARSRGDSEKNSANNIVIQALWAPFLLLHLGGPDTITAYSLEDNELWVRHSLQLVVQVGVAFYVFFWSWSETALTFIAIPIFIIGVTKYGERIFALRSASTKQFKEALLSTNPFAENAMRRVMAIKEDAFFERNIMTEEPREKLNELYQSRKQVGHYMDEAYFLFNRFEYLFANLILGLNERMDCYNVIHEKSAEDAFKLIAIELGFMYDVLYTKATLIYTQLGLFRRGISFLFSGLALVFFSITIDMHAYPLTDIYVTYSLVVGAVFLEVCAFTVLFFSDWTELWLVNLQIPRIKSILSTIRNSVPLFTNRKRWSQSMAQYNLIGSCIKDIQGVCTCVHKLSFIKEFLEYWNLTWEKVDTPMKKLIFEQLQEKADEIKVSYIIKSCKELLARRGDHVIKKYGLQEFSWSTVELEFDHSLLVWHIATDICYNLDFDITKKEDLQQNNLDFDGSKKEDLQQKCQISKSLSNYLLYLLVLCPSMLPKGIGEIRFRDTCAHVRQFSVNKDKEKMHELLFKMISRRPINQSVLSDGCELARKLQSLESEDWNREKKWKMISEVWVGMLAYAASNCGWREHAQQLRRGGELLTHVCLLMAHLGLNEQYNEKERFYFI